MAGYCCIYVSSEVANIQMAGCLLCFLNGPKTVLFDFPSGTPQKGNHPKSKNVSKQSIQQDSRRKLQAQLQTRGYQMQHARRKNMKTHKYTHERIQHHRYTHSCRLGMAFVLGMLQPRNCLGHSSQQPRQMPGSSYHCSMFGSLAGANGTPFWLVGEFTTHFRTYFSGDWDVHRYRILTHGRVFGRATTCWRAGNEEMNPGVGPLKGNHKEWFMRFILSFPTEHQQENGQPQEVFSVF